MTKIKNRVKYLFTKEVFRGENDGFEFLIYSFLINLFLILPAGIYLKMKDTPYDLQNFIFLILSCASLALGLYLVSVNTIRRANKTIFPFTGYLGIGALIISSLFAYPLSNLYYFMAIVLLVLPNKKV